jgi:hypothetical protein
MSSTRVVDLGNVRRSQPGITICSPAGVRSTSDILRLRVDQLGARVAHRLAATYTVQHNPQKNSARRGEGVATALVAIWSGGLGKQEDALLL